MSINNTFILNANCVVIGTDMTHNKKYLLSTSPDEIVFPRLTFNENHMKSINLSLINFLHKDIPYVTDIELLPQLVNLNSEYIQTAPNELNLIYGFVITYKPELHNLHWIEFNDLAPHKYSNIIFEVVQRLY